MKKTLTTLFLSLSLSAYAAVTIVPEDTVRTTPIILPDFGDAAYIAPGGALNMTMANTTAITMNDSNQTVRNDGFILTTTGISRGIDNNGQTGNTIVNNGRLWTNNDAIVNTTSDNSKIVNLGEMIVSSGQGISVQSSDNVSFYNGGSLYVNTGNGLLLFNNDNFTFVNDGTIISQQAVGMLLGFGNNANLINNGLILSKTSVPVFLTTLSNSTFVNNGLIRAEASFSVQFSGVTNNLFVNNGNILSLGNGFAAIFDRFSTANTIVNSGVIHAKGLLSQGILVQAPNLDTVIINSGTIISEQGNAIEISSTNVANLSLLIGSNIQGPVALNTVTNVAVERGLNLALTITPTSLGFGALSIDAPYVARGTTLAVYDPTGLGIQADVLADLSDSILNDIYRRRTGFACPCHSCESEIWVEGIGSWRKRSHSRNVGYKNRQGGFLVGVDTPFSFGNVNVFGGASFGKADENFNIQKADVNSYLGGASYESLWCDNFLGVAFTAGYTDWRNERVVMNNLAVGGIQKARFDKGGVFVAPEVTFAHAFSSLLFSPVTTVTCRYAGLFLGHYSEHGSLTNFAAHDRKVGLVTTKLEIGVPFTAGECGCCWSFEPYVGVFGRFQVQGKRANGIFFDTPVSFDVGNKKDLGAFLAGCRGVQTFGGFSLFLNLEASFDTAISTRVLGEGGIGFQF